MKIPATWIAIPSTVSRGTPPRISFHYSCQHHKRASAQDGLLVVNPAIHLIFTNSKQIDPSSDIQSNRNRSISSSTYLTNLLLLLHCYYLPTNHSFIWKQRVSLVDREREGAGLPQRKLCRGFHGRLGRASQAAQETTHKRICRGCSNHLVLLLILDGWTDCGLESGMKVDSPTSSWHVHQVNNNERFLNNHHHLQKHQRCQYQY